MRFGMVHRLMTNALASLGVIALVASGQFDRWVSGIIVVGLIAALAVRESWQRHPAMRHVDSGALLLIAAIQLGRFIFDVSLLDVLIEFAAALQIIRLATRKGAAHDQQVIVLALLHLIAGTVLGGGLAYGLCFIGVLIVAPGALVLSHLRREVEGNYRQGARDRTGLPVDVPRILRSRRVVGRTFLAVTCMLSVPIFVFTAALFVVFPRVELSLLLLNRGSTGRMIGFSDRVDLGQVGTLRTDTRLAMRIEMPEKKKNPPKRIALHLRGTALDHYDGRAWSQSSRNRKSVMHREGVIAFNRRPIPDFDPVMKIELEPIDPPVIFLPRGARGMRIKSRGRMAGESSGAMSGPEGEYRYASSDGRGLNYEVFVGEGSEPTFTRALTAEEQRRYLEVPADLPPRIGELAQTWTADLGTPREKADAIRRMLRKDGGYSYGLSSKSGDSDQPLDHFLFESKNGHCEFYSTAMAIMLRTVGVPTRNVTGFVGASYNRFGEFYVVRQGDAHSWVEVYLDGQGWVTYDPTPAGGARPLSGVDDGELVTFLRDLIEASSQRWDRHVIGYDLEQQMSLLEDAREDGGSDRSGVSRWSRRRIVVVVGVVLLLGAAAAYIHLRRRRRAAGDGAKAPSARSSSAITAIALYEGLEAAMGAQGVGRAPAVPPLRHAESLVASGHPLGREIEELTEIYLAARFGGTAIGEDARKDYERRTRAVRLTEIAEDGRSGDGSAPAPA